MYRHDHLDPIVDHELATNQKQIKIRSFLENWILTQISILHCVHCNQSQPESFWMITRQPGLIEWWIKKIKIDLKKNLPIHRLSSFDHFLGEKNYWLFFYMIWILLLNALDLYELLHHSMLEVSNLLDIQDLWINMK